MYRAGDLPARTHCLKVTDRHCDAPALIQAAICSWGQQPRAQSASRRHQVFGPKPKSVRRSLAPVRKLTDIAAENHAEALSALLDVNEIDNQVRRAADGFAVWVLDDDDLPRARELRSTFEPEAARALLEDAEKVRRAREQKRRPVAPRRHAIGPRTSPLALGVLLLIGISVVVAVVYRLEYAPPFGIVPADPTGRYLPRHFDWSEPWRLVTPMFIHFGLFHIIFNMMWLRRLGGQIEENHGTMRLLLLALGSAAVSNYVQLEMNGPLFGGMSGVNYALFGFAWMHSRYGPPSRYNVTSSDAAWLMGWLVLCATGMVGPIANAAHAMGLVCGTLCGLPVFLNYRKTFEVKMAFEKGSWEDLNIKGWRRFQRLYVDPYLPAWLLGVAVAVLFID